MNNLAVYFSIFGCLLISFTVRIFAVHSYFYFITPLRQLCLLLICVIMCIYSENSALSLSCFFCNLSFSIVWGDYFFSK